MLIKQRDNTKVICIQWYSDNELTCIQQYKLRDKGVVTYLVQLVTPMINDGCQVVNNNMSAMVEKYCHDEFFCEDLD